MQGQWGGSILDSVVGVFLTQNVSDALSSKAYMNLASMFPLRDSQKGGNDSVDWEAVRTAPVEKVQYFLHPAHPMLLLAPMTLLQHEHEPAQHVIDHNGKGYAALPEC